MQHKESGSNQSSGDTLQSGEFLSFQREVHNMTAQELLDGMRREKRIAGNADETLACGVAPFVAANQFEEWFAQDDERAMSALLRWADPYCIGDGMSGVLLLVTEHAVTEGSSRARGRLSAMWELIEEHRQQEGFEHVRSIALGIADLICSRDSEGSMWINVLRVICEAAHFIVEESRVNENLSHEDAAEIAMLDLFAFYERADVVEVAA